MSMPRYPGGCYQENWRMNRLFQLAFHYGPAQVYIQDDDDERSMTLMLTEAYGYKNGWIFGVLESKIGESTNINPFFYPLDFLINDSDIGVYGNGNDFDGNGNEKN